MEQEIRTSEALQHVKYEIRGQLANRAYALEKRGYQFIGDPKQADLLLSWHLATQDKTDVRTYQTLDKCLDALGRPRLFALSTRNSTRYDQVLFREGDAFLFGPETRGLPAEVLDGLPPEQRLRLPMREGNRSLNLSNAAAVVVYEAWRQLGFDGCA